MQAISIAIGKQGINFFTSQLIAGVAISKLDTLTPPDNLIEVPNFSGGGVGSGHDYSNVKIYLTNGSMSNFHPAFQQVVQTNDGTPAGNSFTLSLVATNFTANYSWKETYHDVYHYHCGQDVCTSSRDCSDTYSYSPNFGSMTVTLNLAFNYQTPTNTYTIDVLTPTPAPVTSNVTPNIPSRSILNDQVSDGCFSRKVADSTAASVSKIDFATPINEMFPPLLESIPASGDLGHGITFDFALGDSGLAFPTNNKGNHDGVTIGVTGVASYKGTRYSGPGAPSLPIPAVPADDDPNHLNVYVSDWAVNGLNWAYYEAGLLNLSLMPEDIPNPAALKTETYAAYIPQFKAYGKRAMQANISPLQAPVTAFQQVFMFTPDAMAALKTQLPDPVYQSMLVFGGDGYVSQADLEAALVTNGIPESYFKTIENATKAAGMVTGQTMKFTLIVQYPEQGNPQLVFDVTRKDIMTGLKLGISKGSSLAQSMQFSFLNACNKATFVSTTIPGFNKELFGDMIWPVVGEGEYAETMQAMGEAGVAIPIMQGFQFLFDHAELSIQDGYVSIGAQVVFKPTQLPVLVASRMMALASVA